MNRELGERIRTLRKTQGKSLRGLGSRTGLSATHLSEIERGRSSPTVSALVRIAYALHRTPAELMADGGPSVALTRQSSWQLVEGGRNGFACWQISENPLEARLHAYLLDVSDGESQRVRTLESGLIMCLYAISGRARVEVGDQETVLEPGGSIQAVAGLPFSIRGEGGQARVLAFLGLEAPEPMANASEEDLQAQAGTGGQVFPVAPVSGVSLRPAPPTGEVGSVSSSRQV